MSNCPPAEMTRNTGGNRDFLTKFLTVSHCTRTASTEKNCVCTCATRTCSVLFVFVLPVWTRVLSDMSNSTRCIASHGLQVLLLTKSFRLLWNLACVVVTHAASCDSCRSVAFASFLLWKALKRTMRNSNNIAAFLFFFLSLVPIAQSVFKCSPLW